MNYYSVPGVISSVRSKIVQNNSRILPEHIINRVLDHFGFSWDQVIRRTRKREIVYCRHTIMLMLREGTNLSLLEIGRLFGCSEHTTVLHGITKMKELMEVYEPIRNEIRGIRENIF